MKKIFLMLAFAGLVGSVSAANLGDDKDKKKEGEKKECCKKAEGKSCAGEKKEACSKETKACCKKDASKTEEKK